MRRRWWLLAKQFPKYALVVGIIVGSTILFAVWYLGHVRAKHHTGKDAAADLAAIQAKAKQVEARIDYLFLADDDLYDAGTGECLFKHWLHGDQPLRLFYDAKSKKILGQYPQGFARYGFDGQREATLMLGNPPAFCPGYKQVVYAKDKNVWRADVDWDAFCFVNERAVTTMGVFSEMHFAENVALLTDKTLVVNNLNSLLRVNLENGEVHPTRIPLMDIAKRRSPDSRWVVGMEGGQFYGYDVDKDEAKPIPVGRNAVNSFLWLNNDKCVGIAGGKVVAVYDRVAHTLTEGAQLPFPCFLLGTPSPDGRYVFVAGGMEGRNKALVDLEKKTAAPVTAGAGITWVSNDTFVFSRDVADSTWRGTWMQAVNANEKRLSIIPYSAVGKEENALLFCLIREIALAGPDQFFVLDLNNSVLMPVRLSHPLHKLKPIKNFDDLFMVSCEIQKITQNL